MTLSPLLARIDLSVEAIVKDHSEWPCRKGCDACCRRLAQIPRFTQAEWEMVQEGIAALPPDTQGAIRERAEALTAAPYVCPMLDRASGACLIYEARPVACRTYGFYTERDLGLYCGEIEARTAAGELENVVWGNALSIEAALNPFGEKHDLRTYLLSGAASTVP